MCPRPGTYSHAVSKTQGLGTEFSACHVNVAQGLILKLETKQKGKRHPNIHARALHKCVPVPMCSVERPVGHLTNLRRRLRKPLRSLSQRRKAQLLWRLFPSPSLTFSEWCVRIFCDYMWRSWDKSFHLTLRQGI